MERYKKREMPKQIRMIIIYTADVEQAEDEVMELIILPLTYKGTEAKKCAVKETVNLAIKIGDKEQQTFVLSGILVFADKIIDASTAKYISDI